MNDFPQPKQKYAGTGENWNFLNAVIFYPTNKTFWNFSYMLFGFVLGLIFQIWDSMQILQISLKYPKI